MGLFDFIGEVITGATDFFDNIGGEGFLGDVIGQGVKLGTGLLSGGAQPSSMGSGDLLNFAEQFYRPRQLAEDKPGGAGESGFQKSEDMEAFQLDWMYRMGRFAFLKKIVVD